MPGGHAVSKLLRNGAYGGTVEAVVVEVAMFAAIGEVQAVSAVSVLEVKRRRPVSTAATSVVGFRNGAIAISGEEDAVTVGAGDLATVYAIFGGPGPGTVIT